MNKIAFTSITNNYLPKARALAHSIKRHSPEVSFVLLLAEDVNELLLRPDDPFDAFLTVKDLNIPDLQRWLFKHTVVEVCTALKGPALTHLLEGNDDKAVLYFDPDMIVTAPLDPLFENFDNGSILLTPHGIEPETTLDGIIDNEISHLRYGVYNLGFVGVRNTRAGLKFAHWWAARLHDFCYDDIERGIFTDQRWVDLAPAFFEGVRVLRDPAYNVATWNLTHRVVTGTLDTGLQVNGRPLIFYHFSGFDSGAQEIMLNKYGKESPVLKDFRAWYIEECRLLGQDQIGALPWTYSKFDNGQPITNAHRRLYRNRQDLQAAFPDPFAAQGAQSYFHWYANSNERMGAALISDAQVSSILVLALEDVPDQVEALLALVSKTAHKSAIEVAAPASVREKLARELPSLRFLELSDEESAPAGGLEDWLLRQMAEAQGSGLIFVQLGLRVPDLWDLRLSWEAAGEPEIATVSPLYNGVPVTSPPVPKFAGNEPAQPEDLDLTVFHSAQRQPPVDSPTFLYECFYVNTRIARTVLRQYLEENEPQGRKRSFGLADFARQCRRDGYSHVITNSIFVETDPVAGHKNLVERAPDAEVEAYLRGHVQRSMRVRVEDHKTLDAAKLPSASQRVARRHLHVMHSWGGGLEHWVRSFCGNDDEHVNMVLKPHGHAGEFGSTLSLYASVDDQTPIAQWDLPIPIKATTPSNLSYRRIINSIVKDYGISVVFVSTLIGHSMDVLKTDAQTIFLCHDYFPLTPEIYVRSRHLSGNRVTNFSVDEVYDRGPVQLFPNYSRAEAKAAHAAFREILSQRTIKLVAPSPSTRRIYLDLAPELNPRDITVIPHGTTRTTLLSPPAPYDSTGRLRIVIPGRAAPEKGRDLLGEVLPRLTEHAEVLLLGCSLEGLYLADIPGVQAISRYEPNQLPQILQNFQPHFGLLLSDFPETFSYMLDELQTLGIPPVAVRIGSFADRVADGLNGFLFSNNADDLLKTVNQLDQERSRLETVRQALENIKPRTEADMLHEYEQLISQPRYSARAFRAAELPPSAYRRIPRLINRSLPLVEAVRPSTFCAEPEYCRLDEESIFLHPPAPGAPDTEITFPRVPIEGASKLTAEVYLGHELSAKVNISAIVRDSDTGGTLGQATLDVAYGEIINLDITVGNGTPAHQADIIFSSRVADPLDTNHCAWLMIKNPRVIYLLP